MKIYHGDNYGTTKLSRDLMFNGKNQEGVGIYFGTLEVAETYGKDIVSAEIDASRFLPSRDLMSDHVSVEKIAGILQRLHAVDNEPLYCYLTDFGYDLGEPDDVEESNLHALAHCLKDDEIRNFQIDMCQRFSVQDFVPIWNEIMDIDGTFDKDTGFYCVINENIEVVPLEKEATTKGGLETDQVDKLLKTLELKPDLDIQG